MKAYVLTIGDELLIGQVIDTNSGWIARALTPLGIDIAGKMTVGDANLDIVSGLDYARSNADVVIITGGLGPTKDDKTVKILADYFGTNLVFNEWAYAKLVERLTEYQVEISESHHQQCFLPESAELMNNSMGTAPGMWFENNGKIIISIPGVPREMKALIIEEIVPRLAKKSGDANIQHQTFLVAGVPESKLSEQLESFEKELPSYFSLAYLPKLGNIRLRLSGKHKDEAFLAEAMRMFSQKIKAILGNVIVAEKDINFAQAIGELLVQQNKTIATAESCTGGYLAHLITANSGSSAYYLGSVIAYANDVKMKALQVQAKTLEKYGAVSEETVKEMASGVRKAIGTDYGMATTGIAGPTGGTPEKPVGTIWVAVSSKEKTVTKKLQLGNNRLTNIEFSSVITLNLLRKAFLVPKED